MSGAWSTVISAVAAVLAGLFLATCGVLQQRAASKRSSSERMSLRLVRALVTDRTWLAGIASAGASYGFQAVALAFGPLVLVQPLVVSELLFAVPVSVRIRGLRLRSRDWGAVAAVVVGLAVGIVAADPQQGQPIQPITSWAPALVAVAVVVGLCLLVARVVEGPPMASAYAVAGACTMGLQSALYAATIALIKKEQLALFATWEPYALIIASLIGAFLIQNAFQSGPLAASTPVIDATLPLVAIGLGVGLFGEHIRTSLLGLAGATVGLLLVLGGIVGLDTSPVVRREQRLQEQEQEEKAHEEEQEKA
ncbi:MAG TPA: DMT family transporter [Nocardioidaceae bacterium]|nr:DMT family transporter [Nocardioidaceae bacterium]